MLVLLRRWQAVRGVGWREGLPVLALAALLAPTYLQHARLLASDGIHYYSYLRSLLFDADLDLANDYALLGRALDGPNVLPVGAPLFWSPLVVLVHLARQAARLLGFPAPTGVEPVYQAAACLATLAYGAAGLFLLQDTLSRWPGARVARWLTPAAAFFAVILAWWGSPLRFYLSVLPGLAHGVEFLGAVLVLRTYLRLRHDPTTRHAVAAGLACGMVFLARSQQGLLLGLPGLELVFQLASGRDRRRTLVLTAVLLAAFGLAALPQVAVWQAMFGVPVLIPHKALHGDEFMHLSEPQLAGTLVSPRGGLFVTHPAMLLAAAGLVALALRDPRYVAAALPVLIAGWYVNATVFDWYHVRRFTGLVPLLAPGLAFLLGRLRVGAAALVVLALLALRYDIAVDELRPLPGVPVPVRAAVQEMADRAVADGYGLIEPRAPRLAVRLLAAYTGERLLEERTSRIALADSSVLRLPQRARSLSELAAEDGLPVRWVREQEARVFLPLEWSGEAIVTVHAKALETVEPQFLEVLWNEELAGRAPAEPAWKDYRFHVAARPGTNVFALRFERGPIYRRVRGEGPREVRPAAVAWIDLHR